MGAAGADWLTREDREKFEQPEKVLDALKIEPGMTVADVGAGNGYFTLRLARRVGETGRVFAVDIQPTMLDLLKKNRDRAGLKGVTLHDLRRSVGKALALQFGIFQASKMLRHSNPAITSRIYAQTSADDLRPAVESRSRVIAFPVKKGAA